MEGDSIRLPDGEETPPSTLRSGELYGWALHDFHFGGRQGAEIVLHSDEWGSEPLPISLFFRGPEAWFAFERRAVELARGSVLDVGAGTGLHTLELQRRGHRVTAVEVLPKAIEIMRDRGVVDARRADVFEFEGGPYDTILLLMNGSGIARTLGGLDRLLIALRRLVASDGQVLVDSADLRRPDRSAADGPEEPPIDGRGDEVRGDDYVGVVRVELEYRGQVGQPFRELYVDPETLARHAESAGWGCQVVYSGPCRGYLARLKPRARV